MSTPAGTGDPHLARRRGSSECKPLLAAATADLYRESAFRITRLAVDATARVTAKRERDVMLLVELGQNPLPERAAFPVTPTPDQGAFREAFEKLRDPEKRFIDEFFWFWPEVFGRSDSDLAIQALATGNSRTAVDTWMSREHQEGSNLVATHNVAVANHLWALDWERYALAKAITAESRQQILAYWTAAATRWQQLATDDRFWEIVTERIRSLNEPSLTPTYQQQLRATLPDALDKVHAELAVAFAAAGNDEAARLHVQLLRRPDQGIENIERAAERVLAPATKRLKESIQRSAESARQNPVTAHENARLVLDEAQPLGHLLGLFLGEQNHPLKEILDDAATVALNCLVAYHKETDDDGTCVALLERALRLAESADVRRRISQNLSVAKKNAAAKPIRAIYPRLQSVSESTQAPRLRLAKLKSEILPALSAVSLTLFDAAAPGRRSVPEAGVLKEWQELCDNVAGTLRGIALDAWNDHHDLRTALDATVLALKQVCDPDLKQRLVDDAKQLQIFLAQQTLPPLPPAPGPLSFERTTPFPPKVWVIGLLAVLALGIAIFHDSPTSPDSQSYTPSASTTTPAASSPVVPTNSESDPSPAQVPPSAVTTPASPGSTYRPGSVTRYLLDEEKTQLESERASIVQLENQLDELQREIQRDRLLVDHTSQDAIDALNAKVARYNTLLQDVQNREVAFNQRVDEYNAKVRRDGL
jgi:hypothetical protein